MWLTTSSAVSVMSGGAEGAASGAGGGGAFLTGGSDCAVAALAVAPRHGLVRSTLRLASADASARRYFRVAGTAGAHGPARTFIVMDSPSADDSIAVFIRVAALIQDAGLNGPRVLEQEPALGF